MRNIFKKLLLLEPIVDNLMLNHSWDEIGNYDLPAVINHILKTTGQSKLSYIGHSLGCGTFFIAMVKHPELNSKIDVMVVLAFLILIISHI